VFLKYKHLKNSQTLKVLERKNQRHNRNRKYLKCFFLYIYFLNYNFINEMVFKNLIINKFPSFLS